MTTKTDRALFAAAIESPETAELPLYAFTKYSLIHFAVHATTAENISEVKRYFERWPGELQALFLMLLARDSTQEDRLKLVATRAYIDWYKNEELKKVLIPNKGDLT